MNEYVIISLKHTNGKKPCFWRSNNQGYTWSPFAAGKYTEDQIKAEPEYYNNGTTDIAVPLTDAGMELIGLNVMIDVSKVINGKVVEV